MAVGGTILRTLATAGLIAATSGLALGQRGGLGRVDTIDHRAVEIGAPEWRLSRAPVWRSAVADAVDRRRTAGVSKAIRLTSGLVVALNSLDSALLLFDQDGGYMRTIARIGAAPGNFLGGIQLAPVPGGGFVAIDHAGRLAEFDDLGVRTRQGQLREFVSGSRRTGALLGVLPDRSLMIRDRYSTDPRWIPRRLEESHRTGMPIVARDSIVLARYDSVGVLRSVSAPILGATHAFQAQGVGVGRGRGGTIINATPIPLPRQHTAALGRDLVYVVYEPESVVAAYNFGGDVAFIARVPLLRANRAHRPGATYPWTSERAGFLADADGSLWCELDPVASGRRWLVLRPDGTVSGVLTTPRNVRIVHVEHAFVLGIRTDDATDVLEMYSLDRVH